MKLSVKAEKKLKEMVRTQEEKYKDYAKSLGKEGQEQDGWHGEMFNVLYGNLLKEKQELEHLKETLQHSEVVNSKGNSIEEGTLIKLKIDGKQLELIYDGIVYEAGALVVTKKSKIGAKIYKKKVGDIILIEVNGIKKKIEILSIEKDN